jgi:hypothetical protein
MYGKKKTLMRLGRLRTKRNNMGSHTIDSYEK